MLLNDVSCGGPKAYRRGVSCIRQCDVGGIFNFEGSDERHFYTLGDSNMVLLSNIDSGEF